MAACALLTVVLLGTQKPERHDFIRLTDVRGTQCGVYTEVGKERSLMGAGWRCLRTNIYIYIYIYKLCIYIYIFNKYAYIYI